MRAKTDNAAMECFLRKYKNFITATIAPYRVPGAEPEDLLQEGMIAFTKAVTLYSGEANFISFARVVIKRHVYSLIRTSNTLRNKALNASTTLDVTSKDVPVALMSLENTEELAIKNIENSDYYIWLSDCLSELEYKVAICLVAGMGITEIHHHLGKSYRSIDNAIQRIRKKMLALGHKRGENHEESTSMCGSTWTSVCIETLTKASQL